MAEMRTRECPACAMPNQPLAVAEGIEEYRCRACGVLYYGPCGCDIVHEVADQPIGAVANARGPERRVGDSGNGRLPEGFEMLMPLLSVEGASRVHKFPGCS